MKRCENCGFSNNDEAVRCIKCNYMLSAQSGVDFGGEKSPVKSDESSQTQPTKVGIRVHTPAWDEQPAHTNATGGNCPQCEYPARTGETVCVRCGTSLHSSPLESAPVHTASPASTVPPAVPNADTSKTVRRVVPETKKGYRLVAISLEDETEQRSIPLAGAHIVMNRDLLDSGNNSISRSGHASLSFRDGQWWLENLSSLKSTFIQVNQPQQIREGDVILIGDRLFKFKAD